MKRDYDASELKKWFESVKANRGTWDDLFEDIATYVLPSQRNFNVRISEGQERMDAVYDATAIYCNERLSSNLHFMATNPAAPWFKIKFRDNALNDQNEAVRWLEKCLDLYKDALSDSNFDSVIGEFWLSLPAFGTACLELEETKPDYGANDPNRFYGFTFQSPHLARTYGIPGADGSMRDTFKVYELNARQAFERFGDKLVGTKVQQSYDRADFTTKYEFCHAVYKRLYLDRAPEEIDTPADKRMFASQHFLASEAGTDVLEPGGYYEQPRFMARWHKRSDDDYGYGIGEKTLPDIHTLNEAKALWFSVTEKWLDNPILMQENNLIGQINLGSRGVTFVRDINGVQFWQQPGAGFQVAELTFEELKRDLREAWFWDRLDMPVEGEKMTAFEFGKRLQRAMQLFGPTLGRLYREALNGVIQRGFNIMYRKKAFPEMPAVLAQHVARSRGDTLDIEYDNPFARAQKSEVVDAIDMYLTDIANMAGVQLSLGQPDTVADLVDWDEAATRKARSQNIPESLLLSDDAVTKLRAERQKRMEEAHARAAAESQAKTLQTASQADVGNLRKLAGQR